MILAWYVSIRTGIFESYLVWNSMWRMDSASPAIFTRKSTRRSSDGRDSDICLRPGFLPRISVAISTESSGCHCPQGRALPHRKIPVDFEIDANNLPITEGEVHFMRLVLENGTICVLNEDFDVGKSLAYEYVWATIGTKQEQLMIYYREKNADAAGLVRIHGSRLVKM